MFNGVPTPTASGSLHAEQNVNDAEQILMPSASVRRCNNDCDHQHFNDGSSVDMVPLDMPASSTATVTFTEFQTVAANGSINVTIAPSPNVAECSFIEVTLSYTIAATGACCITSSQTCQDLSPTTCSAQSGAYSGDGTTCATFVCFPKGACCLPNGTCTGDQVTPSACTSSGGTFQGNGSTCTTSDCRIKGACCVPGSGCSQHVSSDCTTLGGSYEGDNTTCGGDDDGDSVRRRLRPVRDAIAGITVDANGCPPLIPADFDRDGDVDSDDFAAFIASPRGPAYPRCQLRRKRPRSRQRRGHERLRHLPASYSGQNIPGAAQLRRVEGGSGRPIDCPVSYSKHMAYGPCSAAITSFCVSPFRSRDSHRPSFTPPGGGSTQSRTARRAVRAASSPMSAATRSELAISPGLIRIVKATDVNVVVPTRLPTAPENQMATPAAMQPITPPTRATVTASAIRPVGSSEFETHRAEHADLANARVQR